jgi:hypothetical protein
MAVIKGASVTYQCATWNIDIWNGDYAAWSTAVAQLGYTVNSVSNVTTPDAFIGNATCPANTHLNVLTTLNFVTSEPATPTTGGWYLNGTENGTSVLATDNKIVICADIATGEWITGVV